MIQKKKFPAVINKDLPYNENPVASDALNITNLGNDERSARDVAPILGNYPAFDLGSVSQQNKIYRILIPATGTYQVTVKATDNSTVLFTANFSDILTAIVQINIQAAGSGNNANITSGSGFIDIELLPNPAVQAYRWYMTSTGTDELTIQVRQEAIEPTLTGELVDIGGFDLLGDLFIWSSSQRNLPTELSTGITGATNASPIVITLVGHGLVSNQWVLITGVNGNTAANGNWSAQVINANTFSLVNSTGNGAYTGGGTVTIYPSGIGEIGVAQKNMTTLEWTYIRLLRSVEWNFRTKKQIDIHCEATALQKNLYWTDDYNTPRCMYYAGTYTTDGALSFNGGQYEYDDVFNETRLFLSTLNTKVDFKEQLQTGGALKSGNIRYIVRGLTYSLTPSDWSDLSNPVNVYVSSSDGNPEKIIGNISGTITSKINVLTVSGINASIFKYIEVAAIEYYGLAQNAYIVNRYVITGETMEVQHTGNETTLLLSLTEILSLSESIKTAKNIRAIDNRLLLSNITVNTDIDLNNFANQIRHQIVRDTLTGVGGIYYDPSGNAASSITFGEYQDPINVNTKVGYMINDVYRFACKLRYRDTGEWTKNYWVDDIKFDNLAVNNGNPNDNRRNFGLPDLNITDGSINPYAIYLQFTNCDFSFTMSDGRSIQDVFDAISFERAECIPEVLFTGIGRLCYQNNSDVPFGYPAYVEPRVPFAYGLTYASVVTPTNPERRDFVSIYTPDVLFGVIGYQSQGGDTLINFGQPNIPYEFTNFGVNRVSYVSFDGVFTGFNFPANVIEGKIVDFASPATIGNEFYTNYNDHSTTGTGNPTANPVNYMTSVAIKTQTQLLPLTSTTPDVGYYYLQYYRQQTDKYGDKELTQYVTCGNLYLISGTTPLTNFNVFGGDTFTQKTYLKVSLGTATSTFIYDGISFYSQNRGNSQMRQESTLVNTTTGFIDGKVFPVNAVGANIGLRILDWLKTGDVAEVVNYDYGYNIRNGVDLHIAFDSLLIQNNDMPTRFMWSQLKPQNSLVDFYRTFLPLDFQDADNSFGEVSHMENFNGELFALQVKKWLRMFFNTRGILQIQSVADVVIGDGSVMSRPGITISNFGCSNKWSAFKGKSKGGNDVMYWWDNINKMFMRFGGDGTLSISEIKGLEAFAANSLMWVIANDTPADGSGIHGVFHQRFGEAIWIVRAKRIPETGLQAAGIPFYWFAGTYQPGVVVFYDDGSTPAFNQSGNFYRNLTVNNTTVPGTSPNWELIPRTDVNYWSEFSIAFNEKLNEVTQGASPSGFSTYYSPLPFIAHEWNNGYISPRPISPLSKHYEHNRGEFLTWYRHQSGLVVTEQTNEAYVEVVINEDTDLPKLFLALAVNSLNPPFKVSFYSQGHESFILAADFEVMNNLWQAAVKNDILTSVPPGFNDQDTTQLFGTYLRVRFHFTPKQYNSVSDFVMKFNALYRNYTG